MQRKRKVVLHLLCTDRFSGAENVVCQIAHMFRNNEEYDMIYCSPDGPIRDALKERDVAFVPMKAASLFEFKRAIRKVKPDIIHAHDMKASFLAALACRKTKIISHIHNSDFRARRISLKAILFLLGSNKIKHIIWVSNSCMEGFVFRKLIKKKSSVLYNAIDPQMVKKRASLDKVIYKHDIVYVGRVENPKNPFRLVRILNIVKQSIREISVGVVGTGELLEDTKRFANESGLADNIFFYGFMSNPLKILSSAKVMVMTSDREGMPMVALEAMALGIPIVSTPTDGLCELIEPDVTGYLHDDESQFANSVIRIIQDSALQERMSKETAERFKKVCDPDDYRLKLKEIYGKR